MNEEKAVSQADSKPLEGLAAVVEAQPVTLETIQAAINANTDAIRELTKAQTDSVKELGLQKEAYKDLAKQIELSRKAGRFISILVLGLTTMATFSYVYA